MFHLALLMALMEVFVQSAVVVASDDDLVLEGLLLQPFSENLEKWMMRRERKMKDADPNFSDGSFVGEIASV